MSRKTLKLINVCTWPNLEADEKSKSFNLYSLGFKNSNSIVLCEYIYTSNQQTRTVKIFKSVDFFKPVDENPK